MIRNSTGKAVNEKKIRRIMKENGIPSAVWRRKYPEEVYAKRRQLKADVPSDLIRRGCFALEPRKKMAEDITYLHGAEGRAYLNTIEDLFNGEILAYRISSSPDSRLCIGTVEDMVNRWGDVFDGAILHNDLGSSYVSHEYREAVRRHGIRQSIGRVASCYDNAAMESLNSIIKTEALYCRFVKTNVKEKRVPLNDVILAVEEFIAYYNNARPKASLGGMSPAEYRNRNPRGTYPVKTNQSSQKNLDQCSK